MRYALPNTPTDGRVMSGGRHKKVGISFMFVIFVDIADIVGRVGDQAQNQDWMFDL